ncbi:MAG: nitroreductase family protein [Chloroflexota bacterium]|nr:nitroreductase family protein [Chloroflexota bacterium]
MGIHPQDLMTFFRARRSLRRYQQRPIPDGILEQLLEAATWAPSAHNRQPWRFVIIGEKARKEDLARAMGARLRADLEADGAPEPLIEADVGRSFERISTAPLLILLCMTVSDMDAYPDERRAGCERAMAIQSTAMAGQNMLLMASSLGLGACWICAPLFCPDLVGAALDLPPDWQAQGMITIGYPAGERTRGREKWETRVLWR